MVALTRYRKRADDDLTWNYKTPSPNLDLVSKKPKLSSSAHLTPHSVNSTISRAFRYPQVVAPLKREVHAPCRQTRFPKSAKSRNFSSNVDLGETPGKMGNYIATRYQRAKEIALRSLRYVPLFGNVTRVDTDPRNSNVKAENRVEIIDLTLLSHGSDILDLPANKKDVMFKRRNFDIKLLEKRKRACTTVRPQKKTGKTVIPDPFLPVSEEEEDVVACAFSKSNRHIVLATHQNSNIDITGKSLQCLLPGAWLNDEVINVYLGLLKEREKMEPQNFLRCHFFNTFFYTSLTRGGYNYQSVRRWTSIQKLGYCLLECDKIFVPIHKKVHWCLAVINKKDKKFQYLDSLRGRDTRVLPILAKYFVDEVKDKSGKVIDVSSWEHEHVENLPKQQNGFDCGMFMIKYADFYSRDMGLCFCQEHMPYFRLRTAKEILSLKAE